MHWPRRGGPATGGSQAAPAASAPSSSSKQDKPDKDDTSDGKFDPANLERGAAALTSIDKAGKDKARMAFEMASMQETTEQLAKEKDMEVQKTARSNFEAEYAAVAAEEARRTISHMADQERNTAQFKAQVEAGLTGSKQELQQNVLEYRLKREEEQFQGHEQSRIQNEQLLEEAARETMRLKAEHDKSTAVSEAHAAAKGAAQQERENVEIRLRELRAKAAEDRNTRLQSIETAFSGMTAGAQALQDDPSKIITLVGGLTALALGVYSARAATRVAGAVIEKNLSRPPLVRETSRWTWQPKIAWPWSSDKPKIFESIILEEELSERLQWTTNALLNAQLNGTPFRHIMLYGPPGTGKTLFARTLARQSGLDYAVMSGGDLGPLGHEGPNELHKLFNWANKSKKGMVLFVDEADAFLRKGRGGAKGMSEDARNALSVFLHHTGTESGRVAVILATNVPSVLDRAVIDRVDEAFEFPRPAFDQRVDMLQLFVEQYLNKPTKRGKVIELASDVDSEFFKEVAKRTEGMSGRQLAKLILALQSACFGSGTPKLTRGLADTVVEWQLTHVNA